MSLYVTDSLQEQEEEAAPPQKLQELDAAGRENSSPEPQTLAGARLVVCRWEVEGSGLLPSTLRKVVPLPQMNHGDFYSCARWQGGFFHICNLSQAPKAVPGNCFEIYSFRFHNFHGNLKSF